MDHSVKKIIVEVQHNRGHWFTNSDGIATTIYDKADQTKITLVVNGTNVTLYEGKGFKNCAPESETS